jgi:hypothetical protein
MKDNDQSPADRNELEKRKLLLDIRKVEYENQMLERDIESYYQRLENEKGKQKMESRRFRDETIRLVAISLITAATTLLINRLSQRDKTQSEILVEKTKHCIEMAEKIQDKARPTDEIRSLSCNFTPDCGSLNDPMFNNFKEQCRHLCSELSSQLTLATKDSLNVPIVNRISNTASSEAKTALDKLEDSLNKLKQSEKITTNTNTQRNIAANIRAIDNQMDSILEEIPEAPELAAQSKSISEQYTRQTEQVNVSIEKTKSFNDKITQEPGYPQSNWFKEGYFLVYDQFKITLTELQKNGTITIDICNSTTPERCKNFIAKKLKASTGSPAEFDFGAYRYLVRLDHIGNAGKNLFKPAAYITVEKYKK